MPKGNKEWSTLGELLQSREEYPERAQALDALRVLKPVLPLVQEGQMDRTIGHGLSWEKVRQGGMLPQHNLTLFNEPSVYAERYKREPEKKKR